MNWYNDRVAQQIRGEVVVPEQFNGYPGIVHGGIVAAILDETAGRAVLLTGGVEKLMVTMKLEVKYRRPTPTNQPLTVVGWIVQDGESRARVAGEIRLRDGTVTAECEAVLARTPPAVAADWEAEKQYWKVYED